jgi:hypothetical protein
LECGGLTPLSFLLWFGPKKQKERQKAKESGVKTAALQGADESRTVI